MPSTLYNQQLIILPALCVATVFCFAFTVLTSHSVTRKPSTALPQPDIVPKASSIVVQPSRNATQTDQTALLMSRHVSGLQLASQHQYSSVAPATKQPFTLSLVR
jgi:hypothetical protein